MIIIVIIIIISSSSSSPARPPRKRHRAAQGGGMLAPEAVKGVPRNSQIYHDDTHNYDDTDKSYK